MSHGQLFGLNHTIIKVSQFWYEMICKWNETVRKSTSLNILTCITFLQVLICLHHTAHDLVQGNNNLTPCRDTSGNELFTYFNENKYSLRLQAQGGKECIDASSEKLAKK